MLLLFCCGAGSDVESMGMGLVWGTGSDVKGVGMGLEWGAGSDVESMGIGLVWWGAGSTVGSVGMGLVQAWRWAEHLLFAAITLIREHNPQGG